VTHEEAFEALDTFCAWQKGRNAKNACWLVERYDGKYEVGLFDGDNWYDGTHESFTGAALLAIGSGNQRKRRARK
jgi:hypothetical protein